MSTPQTNQPSAVGNDLEKSLAQIKAQIVACKSLKTTLYTTWKAAPKSEKTQKRYEYDDTANKLKILYVQQKALQDEIKITSGKGKKRVPDNSSRRSPRKKARSFTATENSDSGPMVDLDAYDPTPLEPPLHPLGLSTAPLQAFAAPSTLPLPAAPPIAPLKAISASPVAPLPDILSDATFQTLEPSTAPLQVAAVPSTMLLQAVAAPSTLPLPAAPPIAPLQAVSASPVAPLPDILSDATFQTLEPSTAPLQVAAVPSTVLLQAVAAPSSVPLPAAPPIAPLQAVSASPVILLPDRPPNATLQPLGPSTTPLQVAAAPPTLLLPATLPTATFQPPGGPPQATIPAMPLHPLGPSVAPSTVPLQATTISLLPAVTTINSAPLQMTVAPAPLPPAIANAPLLDTAASNDATGRVEKLVVLPFQKMRTVTRGKGAKKDQLKIDKSVTLWHDLTKEQKGKLLYEGKKAFKNWRSGSTSIPFRTRLWARREASFMPELATHSKELAVLALTTRVGNRMCHYHTRYTNHTVTDAKAADQDLHPKITGVPYARTAVKFRIKKEINDEEDEDDGNATDTSTGSYKPRTSAVMVYDDAMSCGCSLEDVLLDFFFWKDTVATSPTTGIQEGWSGETMDPRTRTFVCALLKGQPGIELDWLYEVNTKGNMISLSQMYHKQGQALKRWYQKREKDANPSESDSEKESLLPDSKNPSARSGPSSNKESKIVSRK